MVSAVLKASVTHVLFVPAKVALSAIAHTACNNISLMISKSDLRAAVFLAADEKIDQIVCNGLVPYRILEHSPKASSDKNLARRVGHS